MNRRHARRRGFTLLDLLLTVAIIGILAAVAVPSVRPNDSLKLISAATLLTADLEYAQSATLENPGDPVIVKVDGNVDRYWLALASAPETPIERPSGGPYEVVFGDGTAEFLSDIGISIADGADEAVVFDAFGRLDQSADTTITLTSPTGDLAVRVAASTGSVFIGE